MNQDTIYDKPEHRPIPLVGQRIVKTSIAVFFCLMIYYLRGYSGNDMPTEAMITAIICMQPYVRDSGEFAFNRLAGKFACLDLVVRNEFQKPSLVESLFFASYIRNHVKNYF